MLARTLLFTHCARTGPVKSLRAIIYNPCLQILVGSSTLQTGPLFSTFLWKTELGTTAVGSFATPVR